jgi:diguanylate cyclase (GGDEF)-like protein
LLRRPDLTPGDATVPKPPNARFQDAPTGLSNREHLETLLDFAFHVADRGVSLTVVLLELGGAGAAEEVDANAIRAFGALLASATRTMDVAARLEGGRFAVMLMDCNLHGGRVCADRIRAEAADIAEASGLSVSAGVATYEKSMKSPDELLSLGAAALRVALDGGGDRVAVPADLNPGG